MFVVGIVGRPNVGKSSLFNRIVGFKYSITDDTPGVTRDRIIKKTSYLLRDFFVIDTGGITLDKNVLFKNEIEYQANIAIRESDCIIFVVDGTMGITPDDEFIAKLLAKTKKKVLVAVNKTDDISKLNNIYDFYKFGFTVYGISAIHGHNVAELLDDALSEFKRDSNNDEPKIKFSLIGKPNSGKSSLINAIINEQRVIVSPISGTTTDAIEINFTYNNIDYIIVDTAGLKKKSKLEFGFDSYSYLRTILQIEQSDVCLLVMDATNITLDDIHIGGLIKDYNKACVVVVTKWDLVIKDNKTYDSFILDLKERLKFIDYTEIVTVSSLTKQRVNTLFDFIQRAYASYTKEVKTSILNALLLEATMLNPPNKFNNGVVKINYITQSGTKPPSFHLFINDEKYFHFSYKRYLENFIRDKIDFTGSPIKFELRRKTQNET